MQLSQLMIFWLCAEAEAQKTDAADDGTQVLQMNNGLY